MRQQAKPFTVEVKKSRKSNTEPQPLFGGFFETAPRPAEPAPPTAAELAADKLFGHRLGMAEEVFAAAAPAQPATRILPDLTARPVVAPEPGEPPRRARMTRSPKPAKPRPPKPIAIAFAPAAPVARKATPPKPVMVRVRRPRNRDDEPPLRAGERWKRRLPRFAR